MVRVTVEGTDYSLRNEWGDITLAQYQALAAIALPPKLRKRWEALIDGSDDYDKIKDTYRNVVKDYPAYYGKVIALLSDIPQKVVERIEWSVREQLFNDYLWYIAMSAISSLPLDKREKVQYYEAIGATAFTFKGETYYLPEALEYGGQRTPLARERIVTFAEGADIEIALHDLAEKGIDGLAQLCAVYLRKKDEDHSDDLVLQRMDQFKELPMTAVWEVFFCIMRLMRQLGDDTLRSLKALLAQVPKLPAVAEL